MESMKKNEKIRWTELLPDEFVIRQNNCPIVYLPVGLVEPHGHIAAFGLDTIKAEFICEAAARKVGGIVAPTQGYHIHETGYHAPWLEEVLGESNPYMASVPPDILLHLFLFQLRAFYNAGFKATVVISGHAGGNQKDLRLVAETFERKYPMKVEVRTDPELVEGFFIGDHAGKYEISQLLFIRPDLVDMSKIFRKNEKDSLGRFAQGEDAAKASADLGKKIMDKCVEATCSITEKLQKDMYRNPTNDPLTIRQTEAIWEEIVSQRQKWATWNLHDGQKPAGKNSKWKKYERPEQGE